MHRPAILILFLSVAAFAGVGESSPPVYATAGRPRPLMGLLAAPGERTSLKRVASSDRWTAASGTGTGHWDATQVMETQALYELAFFERQDDAVEIRSMLRNLSGHSESAHYGGPTLQAMSGGGSSEVLALDEGYITAVQICTNTDSQPKLKGARIWGGKLDDEGHVTPVSQSPKFERAHCKKWAPKVACGAQKIATGFRAYWYDVYQKGFSGMGLRCSTITLQ